MPSKTKQRKKSSAPKKNFAGSLKADDVVMVIAGGSGEKRPNKGKTGKIVRFVGRNRDRVIVEGINFITKNQKAKAPDKSAGVIREEGSIHVSNVMFYAEKISRPVRLKQQFLESGEKVRGYLDPSNGKFVQV